VVYLRPALVVAAISRSSQGGGGSRSRDVPPFAIRDVASGQLDYEQGRVRHVNQFPQAIQLPIQFAVFPASIARKAGLRNPPSGVDPGDEGADHLRKVALFFFGTRHLTADFPPFFSDIAICSTHSFSVNPDLCPPIAKRISLLFLSWIICLTSLL
jgi:hypothetical protein